jgi:hypothetical protein
VEVHRSQWRADFGLSGEIRREGVPSPRSEGWEGVKDVTWGERVEGSEEQKRRADHVQPRAKDLAGEVLSAIHATSRGCSINRSCPRIGLGLPKGSCLWRRATTPSPGSGRENREAAVRPPLSSDRTCPLQALTARAGRLKNKAILFRVSYRVAMAEQSS